MEIWKDIIGYEGLYQVSNCGRVKSLNYNHMMGNEKILKQNCISTGYLQVCLYKNKRNKRFLVHRLVGKAFIDNPNKFSEINHKDENKSNNNVNNLEWCDRSYNMTYNNLNKKSNWSRIGIKGINEITNEIIYFNSMMDAERSGFNSGAISLCCKGKYGKYNLKTHKGYTWSYDER